MYYYIITLKRWAQLANDTTKPDFNIFLVVRRQGDNMPLYCSAPIEQRNDPPRPDEQLPQSGW